mmetsp:Transcript_31909/g.77332  ORF Transcript_31909/g.77332 Transcript_31909/m.77332 type:complete len:235 (-) Transcript_31909:467-1171(-)
MFSENFSKSVKSCFIKIICVQQLLQVGGIPRLCSISNHPQIIQSFLQASSSASKVFAKVLVISVCPKCLVQDIDTLVMNLNLTYMGEAFTIDTNMKVQVPIPRQSRIGEPILGFDNVNVWIFFAQLEKFRDLESAVEFDATTDDIIQPCYTWTWFSVRIVVICLFKRTLSPLEIGKYNFNIFHFLSTCFTNSGNEPSNLALIDGLCYRRRSKQLIECLDWGSFNRLLLILRLVF